MKKKVDAPVPYTLSESEIQRDVIRSVNKSGLASVWRSQSGTRGGGRMHLAPTGTPDIVGYTRFGRFVGLEVKRPGKGPSKAQSDAGKAILASGGIWAVVTSAREALEWLVSARLSHMDFPIRTYSHSTPPRARERVLTASARSAIVTRDLGLPMRQSGWLK
jgi:hypothetical protein